MNQPLIDVIIGVYNGEQFIADAIRSVQAQTYANWQLIIVDDGSEDGTVSVILEMMNADSRIKLIKHPHWGLSPALNKAIANSTAPYIAFIDADDLWHAEKLHRQMEQLAQSPAGICFCLVQEFETFNKLTVPSHRARPGSMKGYSKTTFLGRHEVFTQYGLFDETVKIGDFIEWFSRVMRDKKETIMIDEVLAYRRVHAANTTQSANKNDYLGVLKAHLDEKRKNNKA